MQTTVIETQLDEGRWSSYQRLICFGAAYSLGVAAFNNQLSTQAIILLARESGSPLSAYTSASWATLLGLVIGSWVGGVQADRRGRRFGLLSNFFLLAAFTFLGSFVSGPLYWILRALSGITFGAAIINAAILTSEYVPRSRRPLAVTLTLVGLSIGSLAAGLALAWWPYGWRTLLAAAGGLSGMIAIWLWRVLPESPYFLAQNPGRRSELAALMNRMGQETPSSAPSNEEALHDEVSARPRSSVGEIFTPRFRRDTLGLSAALFFCLLAGNIGFQFIPAAMLSAGLSSSQVSNATIAYNVSGIAGAIVGALVIQWVGSRTTMLVMSGAAAVAALVIAALQIDPTQGSGAIATFSIAGMLILGLQATMYTLAVNVYPSGLRGTGVGTALALGRISAAAATTVITFSQGVAAVASAIAATHVFFFFSWAGAMTCVFLSLLVIRRHVLPSGTAFNYLSRRIQRGQVPATARQFEPKVTVGPIDVPLPPEALLKAIRSGECVVVLGSGMSAQAGLPTWSALVDQIIHEALDPSQIPQFEKLRETRSVDDVVDALRAQLPAPDIIGRVVEEITSHTSPDMTTYSILSGLQISGVVSLNVDDLAVRAFDKRGPAFVPRQADRCLDAVSRNEFFVFLLNGQVSTPDEILLSHQNVKDAVSRNDAFRDLLRRLYYSRSLLFIGASLSGVENFLRAIDRTAEPSRTHHALVEVTDSTWEPVSGNLESQFRLKVLPFTPHHRKGAIDRFVRTIDSRLGVETPPPQATKASRITHVELRNIGPFSECSIDLDDHWTVILGDNGVGKSSVMKAIAVGLCGKAGEPFAERLLKSRTTLGEIKVRLGGRDFLTTIARKSGGGVIVQSESGVPLEREQVLAVGYPALRTVGGRREKARESAPQRPNPSDLLPLTSEEPDPRLDNIKQWIVRLDHLKSSSSTPAADRDRYSALFDRIFSMLAALTAGVALKPGGVNANTGEITIETRDGPIPFESLSQGTLSLIGWTGALMQRLYETAPEGTDPLASPVIVLVDEIDAHMHPAWQQALVKRLSEMFTRAQFIVTSHSPLVVGGLEPSQVLRFERNADGVVQISQPDHSLKGMGAAGLLTSDLFGLSSHLDIDTAEALDKKRQLTARRLDEGLSPAQREAIDGEIEELEKQVEHVDATRFVRDPLYPVFVQAMAQVERGSSGDVSTVTLTSEQKRERARIAEAVVREIKERQPEV
jgi:AAHS family 4-hydroxybenzoate transporter-like MFS transporter